MKKLSDIKNQKLRLVLRNSSIVLVTFLILFFVLLTGVTPDQYDIHPGEPASKTVYATKDVEDSVTTEALRDAAAKAVEPSYKSVDTSVNTIVIGNMQEMFASLSAIRSEFAPEEGKEIGSETRTVVREVSPVTLSDDMIRMLLTSDSEVYNGAISASITEMREALNSTLPEGQENAAVSRISRALINANHPSGLVSICTEVIRECIQPNMLIDQEITEANRLAARNAVEPEVLVKREVIVRQGEIVTKAQYQMIASLGLLADNELDLPLMASLALLVLVVFAIIALYLLIFNPELLTDSKHLLLMCIIVVLEVTISLLVRNLNSYLMPVALGAILISNLIGRKTALFVNSALCFLISMLVSGEGMFSMSMFSLMMMGFTAGPVCALILSRRQMRTATLLAGFAIGLSNFVVTLAIGLVSSNNLNNTLVNSVWAIGGGVLSAVLGIGLQSLLEWLFNLATNAKLLELSNPNQPLLRRLLLEAPGTYHHSIIVANLAEAGAAAVGANGLLARVGAYYHDIGKLKRPMYFKENQMGDNPHDRTDPRVSAAILTAHPRDGAQMAQKERIPAQIIEVIRQHHGDSPVLFFYDKAKKLYGDSIDISAFRYEGPRPHSKEAAVVMLADTIEAATRTLSNPSPERMEQLIRKLVREKMDDGQLNESELTFSDLDRICSTFSTVLAGVHHERIEYPEIALPPRDMLPEEPAEENPSEGSADTQNTEVEASGDRT